MRSYQVTRPPAASFYKRDKMKKHKVKKYEIVNFENRTYIIPYKKKWFGLVKKLEYKKRYALNYHEYML